MASSHITIMPDARFARWQRNFNRLGRTIPNESIEEWRLAVEVLFSNTQSYVHVLSGDLLGSGKYGIEGVDGPTIIGHVTYGGGQRSDAKPHWRHQEIDYVQYELARGGSHDFFERASRRTTARLQEGVGEAIKKMMEQENW